MSEHSASNSERASGCSKAVQGTGQRPEELSAEARCVAVACSLAARALEAENRQDKEVVPHKLQPAALLGPKEKDLDQPRPADPSVARYKGRKALPGLALPAGLRPSEQAVDAASSLLQGMGRKPLGVIKHQRRPGTQQPVPGVCPVEGRARGVANLRLTRLHEHQRKGRGLSKFDQLPSNFCLSHTLRRCSLRCVHQRRPFVKAVLCRYLANLPKQKTSAVRSCA